MKTKEISVDQGAKQALQRVFRILNIDTQGGKA